MKWEPVTEEGKKIYSECSHDGPGLEKFGNRLGDKENFAEFSHLYCCLFNDEPCENASEAYIVYMGFEAVRRMAEAREDKADLYASSVRQLRYKIENDMWRTRKYTDENDNALRYYKLLDSVANQLMKIDDELCEF